MVATDHGKARVGWLRKELAAMAVMPTPTRAAPKARKVVKPSVYKGPSLL